MSSLRPSFEDREFVTNSDGQEPAAFFFSERKALNDDQGLGQSYMLNGTGTDITHFFAFLSVLFLLFQAACLSPGCLRDVLGTRAHVSQGPVRTDACHHRGPNAHMLFSLCRCALSFN